MIEGKLDITPPKQHCLPKVNLIGLPLPGDNSGVVLYYFTVGKPDPCIVLRSARLLGYSLAGASRD